MPSSIATGEQARDVAAKAVGMGASKYVKARAVVAAAEAELQAAKP